MSACGYNLIQTKVYYKKRSGLCQSLFWPQRGLMILSANCVMLRAENYDPKLAFQCIDELITLAADVHEDQLVEVNIKSARQSLEALLPVNEPGLAIGIGQVVALLTHLSLRAGWLTPSYHTNLRFFRAN